jgi:hypothetical protein
MLFHLIGTHEKIYRNTNLGGLTSVSIPRVPRGYRHLLFTSGLRHTNAGQIALRFYVNGDTTEANYFHLAGTHGQSDNTNRSEASAMIGNPATTPQHANMLATIWLFVPWYSMGSHFNRIMYGMESSERNIRNFQNWWFNTDPITQIDIAQAGTPNPFTTTSWMELWGIR